MQSGLWVIGRLSIKQTNPLVFHKSAGSGKRHQAQFRGRITVTS